MTMSALAITLFFSQTIAPQNAGPRADLYVNVDVLRVDPSAATISYRDEQGEKTLPVDSSVSRNLAGLKPGDRVILGCQVTREAGNESRLVTEIRKAAAPSLTRAFGPVRAVSVDAKAHILTVADANGAREILSVRGAGLGKLATIVPGDRLQLTFGPAQDSKGTVAEVVVGIEHLPDPTPAPVVVRSTAPVVQPSPSSSPQGIPLYAAPPIPSAPTPAPTGNVVLPATGSGTRAERDLESAAMVLAGKANELDRGWVGFREGCLKGPEPTSNESRGWFRILDGSVTRPDTDACRKSYDEILAAAQAFRRQLDTAVLDARKGGVVPGRIREILQRQSIDLE